MNLQLKRAYDDAVPDDGVRILVDRLWPRGLRKQDAAVDIWLKDIAPSNELRKWIHADLSRWPEFRRKYFAELDAATDVVAVLHEQLAKGKVTLLYAARDREQNHALVLQEYLQSRGIA